MPHISFLFTSAIVNKNQIIIIAMCWCDSTVFVFHCYCCLVLIVFWLLWLDIRFFCISLQIRKFLISIQNMSSYLWRWKALSCARCLRRNSLTFFFIIMLGMYNRNIANSYLALVAVLHKNWFEAFINIKTETQKIVFIYQYSDVLMLMRLKAQQLGVSSHFSAEAWKSPWLSTGLQSCSSDKYSN